MNISQTEAPVRLVANTCGRRDKKYSDVLLIPISLDKKDIIYAEIEANDTLLKEYRVEDKSKGNI